MEFRIPLSRRVRRNWPRLRLPCPLCWARRLVRPKPKQRARRWLPYPGTAAAWLFHQERGDV